MRTNRLEEVEIDARQGTIESSYNPNRDQGNNQAKETQGNQELDDVSFLSPKLSAVLDDVSFGVLKISYG